MDGIYGGSDKKTFLNHVFDTSDESKSLVMNIFQYTFLAIIPIVLLNKIIHYWIPDIDKSVSSLQIIIEIFLQLSIMLLGILFIHRCITYIPTYSGLAYDLSAELHLTNGLSLIFLIIILSLQTKIGIKTNILYERFLHFWNGTSDEEDEELNEMKKTRKQVRHSPSAADNMNVPGVFPPLPQVQTGEKITGGDIRNQMGGGFQPASDSILPANSLLGSFSGLF